MAAVVAFRNHLINNQQLPAAVVNQIIDVHGYDSVQEFASATDREIRDLISTIRKTPPVANDASSPKIVLGQSFAIRILHFMFYSRLIRKVDRQHTIGPAGQATSSINNIRTIGRNLLNGLAIMTNRTAQIIPARLMERIPVPYLKTLTPGCWKNLATTWSRMCGKRSFNQKGSMQKTTEYILGTRPLCGVS